MPTTAEEGLLSVAALHACQGAALAAGSSASLFLQASQMHWLQAGVPLLGLHQTEEGLQLCSINALQLLAHPQAVALTPTDVLLQGPAGLQCSGTACCAGSLAVDGPSTLHGALVAGAVRLTGCFETRHSDQSCNLLICGDAAGAALQTERNCLLLSEHEGASLRLHRVAGLRLEGDVQVKALLQVQGSTSASSLQAGGLSVSSASQCQGGASTAAVLRLQGCLDEPLRVTARAIGLCDGSSTEQEQTSAGMHIHDLPGTQPRGLRWLQGPEWELCGGDLRLRRGLLGQQRSVMLRFDNEGGSALVPARRVGVGGAAAAAPRTGCGHGHCLQQPPRVCQHQPARRAHRPRQRHHRRGRQTAGGGGRVPGCGRVGGRRRARAVSAGDSARAVRRKKEQIKTSADRKQ